MWVIKTGAVDRLNASAVTAWPFVFVARDDLPPSVMIHEKVHYAQQRRWALWGLGVGLIIWHLLYLLALPFGWNPWRARWERAAYRANGYTDATISKMLREPPYYLWWT